MSQSEENSNEAEESKPIKKEHNFFLADGIEVIEGDLRGLTGKITQIVGNNIWMLPYQEKSNQEFKFKTHELKKFFKKDDSVCFISGQYEGDTGIIVEVEESRIVVFLDSTCEQLEVSAEDLQLLPDENIGVHQPLVQFQRGDLVQLDDKTVGVIIRLETMLKEPFLILTMLGKLVNVHYRAIIEKLNIKNPLGIDSDSNRIEVGNMVHVIDGRHKGILGEIRHLYNGFAFLFSDKFLDDCGLFVCETKNLCLLEFWEAKLKSLLGDNSDNSKHSVSDHGESDKLPPDESKFYSNRQKANTADFLKPGMRVFIQSNFNDQDLIGQQGIIDYKRFGVCCVSLPDLDRVVSVHYSDLVPITKRMLIQIQDKKRTFQDIEK